MFRRSTFCGFYALWLAKCAKSPCSFKEKKFPDITKFLLLHKKLIHSKIYSNHGAQKNEEANAPRCQRRQPT
jgi:hypothetical protein